MTQPEVIGAWTIVGELGRGDFATVYRVRRDGPDFALKICTRDDDVSLERLRVEIESLRRLDHVGVPRLLDNGTHDGRAFYVMSLAAGRTLKSSIDERDAIGLVHGDIEAMRIVAALLDVISHVHAHGLVHRDIKDANVLADGMDRVTLIDYGFCKSAGTRSIRSTDSFWRVGSARFSPPAKLDNPGLAEPVHDVFAVGVIAYRLLTGGYPWAAPEHEAAAVLRQAQEREMLLPVREHNSRVCRAVSDFVAQLLVLDDAWRPSAAEALDVARDFLAYVRRVGGRLARRPSTISFAHVLRDPIYGDVRLTDEEYRALDSREMQRLRTIKQLGLTDMVYPGAVHTRLGHSIGCVERVERILTAVERQEGIRVEEEIRRVARLYALTHDVGHIAFGHTIEDELGFFARHDANDTRIERLIGTAGSELGKVLQESEVGRSVRGLLTGDLVEQWRLADQLVSGVTGADVLDYVDRDAFFCGIDHRIDSALVRQFTLQSLPGGSQQRLVSLIGGKYGLRMDREFAVESVLRERYAMFLKVYTHSAKVAASALLGKALGAVVYPTSGRARLREEQAEWHGDETLLNFLVTQQPSKWAAERLRDRRLPRGVYRGVLLGESHRAEPQYEARRAELDQAGLLDPRRRQSVEAELGRRAKVDAQHIAIYCPVRAPGYQRVEHWVTTSKHTVPSRRDGGGPESFRERHLGLWDLWVFVIDLPNSASRSAVGEAAQDTFGMENMIHENRRQGRLF